MSAKTDGIEQGVSTDGTTRRVAPPVLQLTEEDVEESSLDQVEGSIIVFYSSDDAAMDTFDSAMETGETDELDAWVADQLAGSFEGEAEDATFSADLTYHGRTVAEMELGESDSFGVTISQYNGGELDEMGFKVEETEASDVEYRVIAVPPALDDDEAGVMRTIPEDTTENTLRVTPESHMCGTLLAAGAFVGAALAGGAAATIITEADKLGRMSLSEDDVEIGASFEELYEA